MYIYTHKHRMQIEKKNWYFQTEKRIRKSGDDLQQYPTSKEERYTFDGKILGSIYSLKYDYIDIPP